MITVFFVLLSVFLIFYDHILFFNQKKAKVFKKKRRNILILNSMQATEVAEGPGSHVV